MRAARQTWQFSLRGLRTFRRQPAYLAISLVQPVIWLLLFGALFRRIVDIPGFHGGSYVEFLTPGVIVMLAIGSAGWSGMAFVDDIEGGVMDRLLVSPMWRGAPNLGVVVGQMIVIAVQTAIVIGLALAAGAHFRNGVLGVALLIGFAVLLSACVASLSNGLAVLTHQRETLIGAVTMVTLPLTFLSSALMQRNLMPGWIGWIARFNPVNWAVEAERSAAIQHTDWSLVASRAGLLALLLVVSAGFATRAFRSYQRSI